MSLAEVHSGSGQDAPNKKEHVSLRWIGDFTVPRYRATIGHKFPVIDDNYGEDFSWDRGGVSAFPYDRVGSRSNPLIPPPATNTLKWPSAQGGASYAGKTSRTAVRLPMLPVPTAKVKKAVSVVQKETPFLGSFVEKEVLVAPERPPANKGRSSSPTGRGSSSVSLNGGADAKPAAPLTDKQMAATRLLWRQAATGDAYFKNGDSDVPGIKEAMASGAVLDWKNPKTNGCTLFSLACQQNDKDLSKYLHSLNADVKTVDYSKRNVFHHCARQNAIDSLVFLLRTLDPKDINMLILGKDEEGDTPLHKAAEKGSVVICQLLLKTKGTDLITVTNKAEKIAFDVAREYKMHHLYKLLDPLEYVKDQTSLIARIRAKMGDTSLSADAGDDGGDDEEEEDEEGGGDSGGAGGLSNLGGLDRKCNQDRAAVVKAAGAKGKKKGGKKSKKKK
ncbi:unnamed protein product [Amoebophrya sp. A25]|nr:unnamed protein product [Amoebophrya sp. A25]|eukprot:GSA25T00018239001.1